MVYARLFAMTGGQSHPLARSKDIRLTFSSGLHIAYSHHKSIQQIVAYGSEND